MALSSNDLTDIRQSELWGKYLQELSWSCENLSPSSFAYFRKIPLLGTAIKIPRLPLPIPFKKIDEIAKDTGAFLAKLEPAVETTAEHLSSIRDLLEANGYLLDRWSLNPTTTIQIDLTKSEEELLREMEKDTRYSIRLAQRKGVKVKETGDFEQFKNLYFETAKRKGFWPAKRELEALWKIFSKERTANILTAFYENQPLASTLLLSINKIGYYYHAASLPIHREVMAPYLLLWEAMRFLKKKGCEIFDLEGIYDRRIPSTKKWKGFTLFKKGFGGRKVEYLGSYSKYYRLWSKILFLPTRFF